MSAEAAPRTARKRRTRWAIAGLVALVVIVAMIVAWPYIMRASAGQETPTPTTTVTSGGLTVTASGDGQAEAIDTYEAYPGVSGTVASIEVEVGDHVKAGQLLYTIDDDALQTALSKTTASLTQANQQVAQSQQQVSQAELQLIQAENQLDKLESRNGTLAASAAEIEEAEQGVEVAEDSVTSAKAGLSSAKASRTNAAEEQADAQADLENTEIVAPATGIVTAVNVSEGGSVSAGGGTGGSGDTSGTGATASAPVVISDTSKLKITVTVNEVDIADVKAGQEATVTFDAVEGLEIPAKVAWVSPNAQSDGNVTSYGVELSLAKQDKRVRAGMTASADIVTLGVQDALLVPKSSIKTEGTGKYVTVVATDGTQEKRAVTTGPSDDTQVQVLTGLEEGERVASVSASADDESGLRGGAMMMGGRPPGAGAEVRTEVRGGQ